MTDESVFAAALAIPSPADRAAYLDRACAGNPALRADVEALLAAHAVSNPLDHPPADLGATGGYDGGDGPPAAAVGDRVGPYRLMEQIGEGGMGLVFVAEQTEPVRRKVALKVIKPGMDTRQVVARFEAERQALALMDHPHIARVLDAGATPEGRPYFVMELVRGLPITDYCDQQKLPPRDRLALFVQVCQAVQHAHQKGVIHRDIKPSNVLVAPHDGVPVVKVIDFGVAKAVGQSLTDKTIYTRFAQMIGTPLYMSPEQAEVNQLDVDTRADVYALGVLLYELLTGTTPFDGDRFRKAAFDEIRRILREEDPPKPSTRLTSLGETLTGVSARRGTDPGRLAGLVRGELDWIVMRCLEKDRNRRYDTAAGLAKDVQRHLAGELVEARPPTLGYRVRKFCHRNRTVIVVALLFAVTLKATTLFSIWQASRAFVAEAFAEQQRDEAERGRRAAELGAAGLQIDLDLAEIRADPKVGLLRLARSLKAVPADAQGLQEFATFAVLAAGQSRAPLLPPITHDGRLIRASYFSPGGDRLLTLGFDKTARLWDTPSGRQIAVLRGGTEVVFEGGFTSDGATAFTHSLDGVLRLWDAANGSFRTATEPRPERITFVDRAAPDSWEAKAYLLGEVTRATADRLLTPAVLSLPDMATPATHAVELWDVKTGRSVARLNSPAIFGGTYRFVGEGRWVVAEERHVRGRTVHVFSAADGRPVARLPHAAEVGYPRLVRFSPSGRTAATLAVSVAAYFVHLWDTRTWERSSTTGPFAWGDARPFQQDPVFQLLADDRFAVGDFDGTTVGIYRPGSVLPVAEVTGEFPGFWQRRRDDLVLTDPGRVYDTRTWQRLEPPKGRKFPPEIARFAPDGRFVPVETDFPSGELKFLDAVTEKSVRMTTGPFHYHPRRGWVGGSDGFATNDGTVITLHRLPPPERLRIGPDLLELWAQVAVCGELGPDGQLVKWDEPTWEGHRQRLAAVPPPDPDFPFPGYAASDRRSWLRAAFGEAGTDASRLPIARELLRRAESDGDRVDATRWRPVVERLTRAVTPRPEPKP